MRAALASCLFRNGDIAFNLGQIARFAGRAAAAGADLVLFGETFLQGFDALSWDWERDRGVAAALTDPPMERVRLLSRELNVDILTGYVERAGEALYSSAALFSGGALRENYRRVSPGWRETDRTDGHYREGDSTAAFRYRGRLCRIALCGDLWDCPERFAPCDVLFWPVYVSYSAEEWPRELPEYALQAALAAPEALLVNPLSRDPDSLGGAYHFRGGSVAEGLAPGSEGLLLAEL